MMTKVKRKIRYWLLCLFRWVMTMEVEFAPCENFIILPAKGSDGAAGWDVFSTEDFRLKPGHRVRIPFGFKMAFQDFFEFNVRTRSGIDWDYHVHQTVSTLDSDYRGQGHVILTNNSRVPFEAKRGEPIAQLISHFVCDVEWIKREEKDLPWSARGGGSFGSTTEKNKVTPFELLEQTPEESKQHVDEIQRSSSWNVQ